ncbi:MerC domain-containing protein [Rubritalea tangerina]|uniref:MerC domain-containing protein n=2 Tax=Rubritalea tangerina TaxID=430798 RepID=A0ABW4ZF66_9BACT
MNLFTALSRSDRSFRWSIDRWGIFASALCAIHCLITPLIFLLLPSFGQIWAHPSSHWIMALIVIPLALLTLKLNRGHKHNRCSSVAATIGIILIVLGALTPALENHLGKSFAISSAPSETTTPEITEAHCSDSCCPTVTLEESGKVHWEIPLASIITTLGGIFLIVTHINNIRCCLSCKN